MKKLFPPEPKINIGKDGFDGIDKLGRKDFGAKLSGLLTAVNEPIVVAIDGGWGSGKTVFLKCWVGEHLKRPENTDQVVYFDAFANDFLDDPLISLISTLSSRSPESSISKIDKLKEAAVALARPAFRIALAAASSGISEVAGAIAGAASTTTAAELAQAAEKFWQREDGRRAAMDQFRKLLGEIAGKNKLIFVIDELDRCRPDYALALLETIKHFFAVENVHFVLGVNLSELKNMVKVRYGLGTTADTYLQKFIHLNMSLPTRAGLSPEDTAGLFHFGNIANEMGIPDNICREFLSYLEERKSPPSLRDVERLATYAALVAPMIEHKSGGVRSVVCGAATLKTLDKDVYNKLLAGTVSLQDVTRALTTSEQSRLIRHDRIAWARFLDLSVWEKADSELKYILFQSEFPENRPVRIDTFLAKYLETFQLPEPSP